MTLGGLVRAAFVAALPALLAAPLTAQRPARLREVEGVLAPLSEAYGVSGHEAPVRDLVQRLLPSGVRTESDTAGNLRLVLGRGDPVVVFIAHLDEIGFRVTSIGNDGVLALEPVGGLFPSMWEGRPALVHTASGTIPGVFPPRESSADTLVRAPPALVVDVGADSRAAAESLGIAVGSTVTSPKQYTRLAGTRATARSFDDRVGVTALVLAARRLVRAPPSHTVIFLWSTREEIGLEGARAAAAELGLGVSRVHAIDTFVSADAPLESPRFGLAPLGKGAVARALDNSSVTPPALVDSLVALAARERIPLQIGATNGGNDGSVFAEYGVPDVPIGWPLRYSHSPVETVDLADVVALVDLVTAAAARW